MRYSRAALIAVSMAAIASVAYGADNNIKQNTDVSAFTKQANDEFYKSLPFATDKEDFDLATRGFIATTPDKKLHNAKGEAISNLDTAAYFNRAAPETFNPSLWRNAQLLSQNGLFKVSDRIYQIRGFSISNMTIIVGDTGYIIVDPGFIDPAREGIELVYKNLGKKPIKAVIYTHSHVDHYGGVRSIVSDEEVKANNIPIIAPQGFVKEIVNENITAGPAMIRRAKYQFGSGVPYGDDGNVTLGIGPNLKPADELKGEGIGGGVGRVPILPNREITKTSETITIDGVKFEFQITPGTEAPAEMNFYLPDFHALCLAENANSTMHNILTPRGALVRDAKQWADYLTQSIDLYGDKTDVLFTSHFWPHWGKDKINDYLEHHRDAYKYLHDQSVRLMNDGLTGPEIAENLKLPPELGNKFYNRDYYGTMSHNSKAVYQRYMGWYDGNPANLNALPPEEAAVKYVAAIGGEDKVYKLAEDAFKDGQYRWSSELLNKLVFADKSNKAAKELLAKNYEQLAYQSESANWRNIYLTGAQELRDDKAVAQRLSPIYGIERLPQNLLFDILAVRLNPQRAAGLEFEYVFTDLDTNKSQKVSVKNSVLIHEDVTGKEGAKAIKLSRKQFLGLFVSDDKRIPPKLKQFTNLFDGPLANFPIVTP